MAVAEAMAIEAGLEHLQTNAQSANTTLLDLCCRQDCLRLGIGKWRNLWRRGAQTRRKESRVEEKVNHEPVPASTGEKTDTAAESVVHKAARGAATVGGKIETGAKEEERKERWK
jgi:hypothetical protein